MKYKVNNKYIVDAKSHVEAVKAVKKIEDSKCKDANITPDELRRFCIKHNYYTSGTIDEYDNLLTHASKWDLREIASDIAQHTRGVWTTEVWSKLKETFRDSVKDNDDIDYLSKEEEQAIDDYKKAISNTKDPKLLKIFGHILKEEVEHLEELQNEELEDSTKDSRIIKISELKEGDKFKDPYYNDEPCIVEEIDFGSDGDYKIKSLKSGQSFWVKRNKNVLIDSIKDDISYKEQNGQILVFIDGKLVGKFSCKEDAREAGYNI